MAIDLAAIRLRNQKKAAAAAQQSTTPNNQPNNGMIVLNGGGSMATANALAQANQNNGSTTPGASTTPAATVPKTTTPTYSWLDIYGDASGKKSTTATPIVKAGTTPTKIIDPNTYKYGQSAIDANTKDNTYLTNRNNDLAWYYAGKNISDSASILTDLKKNAWFSSATIEEQNNTARAIADRIAAINAEKAKGEQWQWSVTSNNSLTGIDQLNTDLDKLVKEGNKASNQTVDSFINTRIQVDKNKANYTNFDAIDKKAQDINTALRTVYMEKYQKGDQNFMNPPTPEEIQAIAAKTGTTTDDVTQFLQGKLFENQLVETDEYRQKAWKSFDRAIQDLTTQKDRQLQDLDLKLQRAEQDTDYQIQEVEKMLERNINVSSISWGLSGALQSSNYVQWITNLKTDAQTAINRIKDLWKRQQTATGLEKDQILKDYSEAVTRAKTDLDDSFKEIRANAELQLSNAKQKYNLDPENLLDALTKIGENVDLNKINVFNNYVGAMNNVFSTVQSSINMVNAAEDRIMGKQEKVMEYYTTNNWLALMNAKPSDIANQVRSWALSVDQAKTLMQYKVGLTVNTLRNAWINANVQQITEMLSVQDMTPQEVLSSFGITTPTINDKSTVQSTNYNNMININWGAPMWDLRWLASQFPGQAWAKNNNPAGITWNANFDNPDRDPNSTAARLKAAGINFSKGTPRPANEWWNYVTFATIEDGLAAQRIMMQGTYGNATVWQMLAKWVGTKEWPNYAKQVAWMAWISDLNTKVWDLSEDQMNALQMAKIKKESPGLAKILAQNAWNGWWSNANDANNIMNAFALVWFDKPTLQKQEQASLQNLINKWNIKDAQMKLLQLTKEWLSSAESRKDFEASITLHKSLQQVQNTLDKLKAKWVDTNILSWSWEKIANKIGKLWNAEISKIATTLKDQMDSVRRSRSWAALTNYEEEFYNSIFPSAWKDYNLNTANISWLLDSRFMTIKSYVWSIYWDEKADYILNWVYWSKQDSSTDGWWSNQSVNGGIKSKGRVR